MTFSQFFPKTRSKFSTIHFHIGIRSLKRKIRNLAFRLLKSAHPPTHTHATNLNVSYSWIFSRMEILQIPSRPEQFLSITPFRPPLTCYFTLPALSEGLSSNPLFAFVLYACVCVLGCVYVCFSDPIHFPRCQRLGLP